jgi:hypothetical protein
MSFQYFQLLLSPKSVLAVSNLSPPLRFSSVSPDYSLCGIIQWKPLSMITLEFALFDKNNWLITLSGGYKNLHYLTQFIGTVQP